MLAHEVPCTSCVEQTRAIQKSLVKRFLGNVSFLTMSVRLSLSTQSRILTLDSREDLDEKMASVANEVWNYIPRFVTVSLYSGPFKVEVAHANILFMLATPAP